MLPASWRRSSGRTRTSSASARSRSARTRASCSPAAGRSRSRSASSGCSSRWRAARARSCAARTSTRASGAARLRDGDRSIDVYVHKLRVKLEEALPELALHPHARGLRLPLRAGAFTPFSHTGDRSVTGCAPLRCEAAAATGNTNRGGAPVRSNTMAGRRRGRRARRSASPPAAATTARAPAARRAAARARRAGRAARSTARARRSRPPSTSEWAARFKDQTGTTVNYQAVGSGGGIAQFTAGTVDFGATDAPMKPEEEAAAKKKGTPGPRPDRARRGHGLLQRQRRRQGPEARRPDDRRHLPRQDQEVERPGDREAQPGRARCPTRSITVCHRSDESGTTKNFTEFLADYSPEWKSGPGVDKTVKWPTGTGAKGNDGVAGCVKQTDGAIGYVEQAYALQNNFTTAAVKNKDGQVRRAVARRHVRRRRGRPGPGRPEVLDDQRARARTRTRSPR